MFAPMSTIATSTGSSVGPASVGGLDATAIACPPASLRLDAAHHRSVVVVRLRAGLGARPRPIWLEQPCVRVVGERAVQSRVDVLAQSGVLDGDEHLDPVVEVARHEIGAADVRSRLVVRLEGVDAAVLQEPADDGTDADVLGQAFDARAESARCARDDVDVAPSCDAL